MKPFVTKMSFALLALLLALVACSNSLSIEDMTNDMENGNFTNQCGLNERGDDSFLSDSNECLQCEKEIPAEEHFLYVPQGKLIPNATFTFPFVLKPPIPLKQGLVRCTFDGSEPSVNSLVMLENRNIDSTVVVRCAEFENGLMTYEQTETYFIDETVRMPVISISVSPNYMSEYLDAEPCKPDPCKEAKFWEDVEYPSLIEFFSNGDKTKEKSFEIKAGISIAGNASRNQKKKSISITMRKKYQKGKLCYPLFDTRPEKNMFDAFILRNNGQRFVSDYIEDAVATALLEGTNVDYQRSKPVVVFVNGVYRGIYDMREKLNEHFVETNYGLDGKRVDFVKHYQQYISTINGSSADYFEMLRFVNTHDLSEKQAYDSLKEQIDIINYMEYMAAEIYYRNGDWPQNNVRAWKSENGRWKFIAFDIDHGFGWSGRMPGFFQETNMLEWIVTGGNREAWCFMEGDVKCFHNVFAKLVKNTLFKKAFINRSAYLYSDFVNSVRLNTMIDKMNASIDEHEVQRDMLMYKRPKYTNFCGTGFDLYGDCLKIWAKERDNSVRNDLRTFFELGSDVPISIIIKGLGRLKLDDADVNINSHYNWIVFENNPMKLSVECYGGARFKSWENGSSNPDRTIYPKENYIYKAECVIDKKM
ncbi:CotH kinase family protein [Fibrobacter sp.]|uniref:CotH kinase family protein n=1 Tax=Fibrobacter sp. TaxID=35828 RepID=UPI003862E678